MTSQFFRLSVIGLAIGSSLFAQAHGPTGGGPAGGGLGSKGPTSTQPTTIPNNTTTPDLSQHPLFITGKVTLDDGTSPPDAAMIQLVCHASPKSVGRTDSKGNFSIDLNNRSARASLADASEASSGSYAGIAPTGTTNGYSTTGGAGATPSYQVNTMDRDLTGCDLQAALPGFRSDVLHLASHRDDPNVGIMIMHRLANVEGTTISLTTAMAPKDARKAMEKAQNDLKKDKWEDAEKEFQKAVEIYPKYAIAWEALGRVQEHLNNPEAARKSFAMAVEADGKLVPPYLSLAALAAGESKWPEVSDYTERALKLNPVDFPQAYLLNSMSNFYLKKMAIAEKSAREGLDHDAEHRFPRMNEVLGAVLMEKRDYPGAAEQFRKFLQYAPEGSDTSRAKKQLADLEKVLSPEAKK